MQFFHFLKHLKFFHQVLINSTCSLQSYNSRKNSQDISTYFLITCHTTITLNKTKSPPPHHCSTEFQVQCCYKLKHVFKPCFSGVTTHNIKIGREELETVIQLANGKHFCQVRCKKYTFLWSASQQTLSKLVALFTLVWVRHYW